MVEWMDGQCPLIGCCPASAQDVCLIMKQNALDTTHSHSHWMGCWQSFGKTLRAPCACAFNSNNNLQFLHCTIYCQRVLDCAPPSSTRHRAFLLGKNFIISICQQLSQLWKDWNFYHLVLNKCSLCMHMYFPQSVCVCVCEFPSINFSICCCILCGLQNLQNLFTALCFAFLQLF